MASSNISRKQINIRLDMDTEKLLEDLQPIVSKAIGLQVSQSDLFRLGMLELWKKYKTEWEAEEKKKGKRS